jgi:tetratricopeptide (TPR) repeat protein
MLMALVDTAAFASKDKDRNMDVMSILTSDTSAGQKIEQLEGLHRITILKPAEDHLVHYSLATLYLDLGDPDRAEILLNEDLKKGKNVFHAYESYSLLMGIYWDRKREIPENEIARYLKLFRAMKKHAPKEIQRLTRKLEEFSEEEPNQAEDEKGFQQRKRMLETKRKIQAYEKDPFQFERMVGDYYYSRKKLEQAYNYYRNYYGDLEKPVESYQPASMRNYVDILLKRNETSQALLHLGYIVNLWPYMFDDLLNLVHIYYELGDGVNALLLLMFIHTLSDGYNISYHTKCEELITKIIETNQNRSDMQKILYLTEIYLTGTNASNIQFIIDGLRKDGVRNFFFFYLEGMYHFFKSQYAQALKSFSEFNEIYPFLADSYYFAMVSLYHLAGEKELENIALCAEKAVELKPCSELSKGVKKYLGNLLALRENEYDKLLLTSEIQSILDGFTLHGAPTSSLDALSAALCIERNPYQVAQIQLMAKVDGRYEEYVSYLKDAYGRLNDRGRESVVTLLSRMGEKLD